MVQHGATWCKMVKWDESWDERGVICCNVGQITIAAMLQSIFYIFSVVSYN
jgi:hypothetical protein